MSVAPIELLIDGRSRDIGGFPVKRVLPWRKRRMVGPFVFFDQMGPEVLAAGRGIDVRAHPHIGLSTITYLFSGSIVHRDSLGIVQTIEPGAVNWMTAGKGIVHSERTGPAARGRAEELFGLQVWVALPRTHEEVEPSFTHYAAASLPPQESEGCRIRVITGSVEGITSPVETYSPILYAEIRLAKGARIALPRGYEERGVYTVAGSVSSGGDPIAPGVLAVFGQGEAVLQAVDGPAHFMFMGGDRLEGERFVEWNFVSSSKDRIADAKNDWLHQRFPTVPGETEYIPLPEPKQSKEVFYP